LERLENIRRRAIRSEIERGLALLVGCNAEGRGRDAQDDYLGIAQSTLRIIVEVDRVG